MNDPHVVDLFAGSGGLSLGFENAGFEPLLGVEFDEKAASTYRKNIAAPCVEYDLSTQPTLPVDEAHVDVLAGGPPCQGFSVAGKRDESDERNALVFDFLHYVDELSPSIVVIENVEGLLSMGSTIEDIHSLLDEYEYTSEHRVLDAKKYGVPQTRDRVFVVAVSSGDVPWPEPSDSRRTVGDALQSISGGPNRIEPRHQQKTIDRISQTEQGKPLYDSYTQRVRLDPDECSPTLVCGGPRPQWQQAHPYEDRGLTVRERAALQTFPDWYEFVGGVVSGRVQTGNAVPVELAESVATVLRTHESVTNDNKVK